MTNYKFNKNAIDNLQNYVYKLIDPRNGKVFYIGKGSGNRVFDHINGSIKKDSSDFENISDLKMKTITEIHNANLEVIHIIHRHHLTSEQAFAVEAALIDEYSGLSNIQAGHWPEYGPMNANSINEYYNKVVISNFDENDKLLLIKITQQSIDNQEGNIYEAVRKAWHISLNRKKVKQVAAVCNGVVLEVFKVDRWKPVENVESSERYEFEGKVIEKSKYKDKLIPENYRQAGAQNPIRYTFST